MTTLAVTQPPLRRLFERLDFAPKPIAEELKQVFDEWNAARGQSIAPPRANFRMAGAVFVCRSLADKHDYVLVQGEAIAEPLLGNIHDGQNLSEAENRRGAVRLRRLFDEVLRIGEPALVEFTLVESGRDHAYVELLAAPLANENGEVDAVLSAFSVHAFDMAAPARPSRAPQDGPAVFALGSSRELGARIAAEMGLDLSPHEEREFEDGEFKIRPLMNMRGRDAYVVHSLHGESDHSGADKLVRLLFFIGALRDAGAAKVTAVTPYLCYARKDRRTKPHDPVTTRYVAQMLESVGADRVVTLDVHNIAAFQNAFRIETVSLDARGLFADYFAAKLGDAPVAVVSPDLGGEKRAELFRQRLEKKLSREVAKGFMEKHRSMGVITGEIFAGDVKGRTAIILDDLIAGGGTMARAAAACRAHGATRIWLAATHGLFSRHAEATLGKATMEEIVVTDAVAPPERLREQLSGRLTVLSCARLLAHAIEHCHSGGSASDVLESEP